MRGKELHLVVLIFALLACTSGVSVAQEAEAVSRTDEVVIRSLEDQERLAVLNRDHVRLQNIWSERFMVNAPNNRVSPDPSFAVNGIKSGLIHYSAFERIIEAIRIDGDIAIVMGAETIQPTGNAPHAGETVKRRFTHFWKRSGGTWRLIARHANVVPAE